MPWMPTVGTQIIAHMVGDYLLQPHWLAVKKREKVIVALGHSLLYLVPFLIMRPSWLTMGFVVGTHFILDYWHLARFVIWAQSLIGPRKYRLPFPRDRSDFARSLTEPLTVAAFIVIVTDDVLHFICNAVAFAWFGTMT